MPFLAYLVILAVSVSGILLELDWLTKPKLETRPAVQTASAAAPVKADGPSVALSPVRLKNADDAASEKPAVTTAAAEATPAETAAAAPAETAQASPQVPAGPPILSAPAMDAPTATITPAVVTPVVAKSEPKAETKSDTKTEIKSEPQQAQNQCNIAACGGAYRSFRASDCSYQPVEGARRLCELTPGAAKVASQPREWHADSNARQRSKDAELRDVARKVKEMTAQQAADIDDGPEVEGRVITLRDRPRNWRSW